MTTPPLPKIEGDTDLVLDIYTHGSLRPGQNAMMNEEYGDTDRLAELGHRILDLAVTSHYFFKRPILSAEEVDRLSKDALSDEKLEAWLEAYGLRHKLFFARDRVCTPAEIRRFFDTYVGALHIRSGGSIIQDWISRLIDPDAEPKPVSQEPTISNVSISLDQQNWGRGLAPMPPSSPPPPLPSDSMSTTSVAPPNIANIVSLALVNQTAAQRGATIFYSADQVGPPHMPTWTVKCLINGVEQGRGTGKSQKIAKEEAARQAWVQMGW